MKQTWSDLLFMHWRVDEAKLRELVPPPLEIDTFDGSGWIAVSRSYTAVDRPAWPSRLASKAPTGPYPTMATSYFVLTG